MFSTDHQWSSNRWTFKSVVVLMPKFSLFYWFTLSDLYTSNVCIYCVTFMVPLGVCCMLWFNVMQIGSICFINLVVPFLQFVKQKFIKLNHTIWHYIFITPLLSFYSAKCWRKHFSFVANTPTFSIQSDWLWSNHCQSWKKYW